MFLAGVAFLFVGNMYISLQESGELEQSLTAEEFAELQTFGDLTWLFYVFALGLVLAAVLNLFLGIGFWKGQNWSRIFTLVFAILGIPFALFSLYSALSLADIFSISLLVFQIVVDAFIIWYLLQKDVIHFFSKKKVVEKN